MADSESDRQYDTINMMASMHAVLRDRYERRAFLLNISRLCAAVALNAFVFAKDEVLKSLFFGDAGLAKQGLGIVSILLLVAAIIELRVNWVGKARSYGDAVLRLSRLKSKYRQVYSQQREGVDLREEQANLSEEYGRVMADLPPIPDRQFARLKTYHKFKCEISRQLDHDPTVPYWLVWLRLRISGVSRGFRRDG